MPSLRVALVLLVAALVLAAPAASQARSSQRDVGGQSERYVVVYDKTVAPSHFSVNVETGKLEAQLRFASELRFHSALSGFAARLMDAQAAKLRRDPNVDMVTRDRIVHVAGRLSLTNGETVPTGVSRIGAASQALGVHAPSTAAVAVLDTGVDSDNGELNVEPGVNCTGKGPPSDDNGHGTFVGGIIAARNQGAGIVGVAPDTKLYSVKVLGAGGDGLMSEVICGIDWVTANARLLGIRVANLSLEGPGPPSGCATDPLHLAICNSTAAGVTYVVAAGNEGRNIATYPQDVPAAFPEVLTVTAMSDSDGKPGALGGPAGCDPEEEDDSYASFSNYATRAQDAAHVIAAPGVCISSTLPGGGYDSASGTSAAAPHAAGVVALCMGEGGVQGPCSSMTPSEVIQQVRADAEANATFENGFSGDPMRLLDAYFGYLVSGVDPSVRRIAEPAQTSSNPNPLSAPPSDSSVDLRFLRVHASHKAVRVTVVLGEAGRIRVGGRLRVPAQGNARRTARKTLSLRPVSRAVSANMRTRLRLEFKGRLARAIRRAFRRHRRPRANVTVVMRDLNENQLVRRRRVHLRR